MAPNDQGSDPTLPRCKRAHSLHDYWPPDLIQWTTHQLGFADFLGPHPLAVLDPACTGKQLVQSNPLYALDSEDAPEGRVSSNSCESIIVASLAKHRQLVGAHSTET